PAEMSNRETAEERFAEWKEILADGQVSALGWLRWAVPVDLVRSHISSVHLKSIALAVAPDDSARDRREFFDEDDGRQLPAEFEHDRLQVALSVLLALPFSVYLEGLEPSAERGGAKGPHRRALDMASRRDTLDSLIASVATGEAMVDLEGFM